MARRDARLRRFRVALALVLTMCGLGPIMHAGALELHDPCAGVPSRLAALGLKPTLHVQPTGIPLTVWSGYLPSWDGLPLAIDVTTPVTGCRVPLVSLNHGYGGSRTAYAVGPSMQLGGNTWTSQWNNVWFAAKGDAVLTVTARGFADSCGPKVSTDGTVRGLPAACRAHGRHYWIQLDDMRYNARDIQWVIGRLVDTGLVDPSRIAVSGASMGGALAWELALLNDRVACASGYDWPGRPDPCHGRSSGLAAWRSPKGVPLHIAAAVPMFAWGSLGTLLTPNGRATTGRRAAPTAGAEDSPIGIPISSWISSLGQGRMAHGFFEPRWARVTDPSWGSWFAALRRPIDSLTTRRGTAAGRVLRAALSRWSNTNSPTSALVPFDGKVPVLQVQGMDDSLATPVLAEQMWAKAKAYAADYPIGVVYADVGHAPATNAPLVVAAILERANAFLDHALHRVGLPPRLDTTLVVYRCGDVGPPVAVHAPDLSRMRTGAMTLTSTTVRHTSNRGGGAVAQALDPLGSLTCPVLPVREDPGVASWSWPVTSPSLLAGAPVVAASVRSSGRDAELNTRLWDVSPDGTQALVSRGTYRLTGRASQAVRTVTWSLHLTCWQLLPGHRLKLEITGYDAPTYQPDRVTARVTVHRVSLHLPTTNVSRSAPLA